jgi:hypothetical protein
MKYLEEHVPDKLWRETDMTALRESRCKYLVMCQSITFAVHSSLHEDELIEEYLLDFFAAT